MINVNTGWPEIVSVDVFLSYGKGWAKSDFGLMYVTVVPWIWKWWIFKMAAIFDAILENMFFSMSWYFFVIFFMKSTHYYVFKSTKNLYKKTSLKINKKSKNPKWRRKYVTFWKLSIFFFFLFAQGLEITHNTELSITKHRASLIYPIWESEYNSSTQ